MAGKYAYGGLVLLLVSLMLLQAGVELAAAQPKERYVGDTNGWTFGVMAWPNSPSFKNFGFGTCTTHPANAAVSSSGNDRITLTRGEINFISGKADDCEKGLKITAYVRP